MQSSKTQEAKSLYKKIRDSKGESELTPGLYRYGLKKRWHWVVYGERAYEVKNMSNEHLRNTIIALKERHPDELRKPLVIEYLKRQLRLWRHKDEVKVHVRKRTPLTPKRLVVIICLAFVLAFMAARVLAYIDNTAANNEIIKQNQVYTACMAVIGGTAPTSQCYDAEDTNNMEFLCDQNVTTCWVEQK